jgi:hypothetical protein
MTRFTILTASLFVASLATLPIAASAQPASTDSKPTVPATAQTGIAAPAAKHTVAVTPSVKHAATPATGAAKAATPAATTTPAQPKPVDQAKS